MQVREHSRIRARQLRQPYYFRRWFYCTHRDCKTTMVMQEEFKVWNSEPMRRLQAIKQQLQPRS